MKLILWVETKQPAKVPRDVLSHHDCPLSTSISRASDPQLYSSSLQPRTHIYAPLPGKPTVVLYSSILETPALRSPVYQRLLLKHSLG